MVTYCLMLCKPGLCDGIGGRVGFSCDQFDAVRTRGAWGGIFCFEGPRDDRLQAARSFTWSRHPTNDGGTKRFLSLCRRRQRVGRRRRVTSAILVARRSVVTLEPAAATSEAEAWEDSTHALAPSTTTSSDEPEDLEATPEPQPPQPPEEAEAEAAGGREQSKQGYRPNGSRAKPNLMFVKVGAMMIGFLVAEIPGAIVGFVVSDTILRLFQRQSVGAAIH